MEGYDYSSRFTQIIIIVIMATRRRVQQLQAGPLKIFIRQDSLGRGTLRLFFLAWVLGILACGTLRPEDRFISSQVIIGTRLPTLTSTRLPTLTSTAVVIS